MRFTPVFEELTAEEDEESYLERKKGRKSKEKSIKSKNKIENPSKKRIPKLLKNKN